MTDKGGKGGGLRAVISEIAGYRLSYHWDYKYPPFDQSEVKGSKDVVHVRGDYFQGGRVELSWTNLV